MSLMYFIMFMRRHLHDSFVLSFSVFETRYKYKSHKVKWCWPSFCRGMFC